MKKIKILYTIPNFDTAGSGKVVYDLVKGLDPSRFEVHIACFHDRGAFFKEVEALGRPIHIVKTITNYYPYVTLFSRIWSISRFFRRQKFDLVHSWQWSNDWTEAVAAKLSGSRWIYTKKAMGYGSRHWRIKSYLADFIITINDEMRQYFPNKKAQGLIPLGLDTDYYSPIHFQHIPSDGFRVITVANLVPVKGIEILIKAIKLLDDPNTILSIVGRHTDAYGDELKQLVVDLGMEQQVVFHGPQLDVRPFFANADLYVIPTLDQGRKEGMPMALVEAMSLGIPVLGSDISGINFVLKDFKHLLFGAGNALELSKKIRDIRSLPSQERLAMGDSLRTYCLTNFTLQGFVSAHETLYRKLLQ